MSNSGTYIRSQYNLNPPPPGVAANCHNTSMLSDRLDHHMDISLASPDDLPPPGYDPSLTLTVPSDGPPSTIGDPGESSSQVGGGSIVGVSVPRPGPALGIAAQPPIAPPQMPPTYLSSAMSTSSADSGSNTTAGSSGNGNNSGSTTSFNPHPHHRNRVSGAHQMRSFATLAPNNSAVSSNQSTTPMSSTMPKGIGKQALFFTTISHRELEID